jgi:tetratricopeptide (TPR) repeat protein
MKKSLGMKHPRTGQKLLQLGQVYRNVNDDLAIQYLKRAADVYKESDKFRRLVSSTLNDVAVMHIQRREYLEAVELLTEALESLEGDTEAKSDTEYYADKVQIWRNMGEAYQQDKQFEKAVESFVKALDLQRDGRQFLDSSNNADKASEDAEEIPPLLLVDDESIAETLRRLGKAYALMSQNEHALMVYKEALLIHQIAVKRVMTHGRTSPTLPVKQDQLAHTLFCIAEVHDAMGQNRDAARLYSESLQLRLFSDAHRPKARTNMVHCAMCLFGMGGIHMKYSEWAEAIKVLKDALNYCNAHGTSICFFF